MVSAGNFWRCVSDFVTWMKPGFTLLNERPLCVFVFLSLSVSQPVWAEDSQPLTLWFESPGTHWESEGLPIGNGALGAVLLGGVKTDRIQFNEKTLWTGGPGSIEGYDFGVPSDDGSYLVKNVREVLQKKSEMEPAAVAKILGRKTKGYGHYQNFGEVNIHFSSSKKIKNYRRELNLNEGIARVSYNEGGIHFVREYFCSYPDNVIVIRLSADKPKSINFSINYKIPNNRRVHSRVTSDGIIVEGALLDNGLTFATQLQLVTDGGVVQSGQVRLLSDKNDNSTDNTIEVSHADSAWLVLSAATNYEAKFPHYRGVDPLPLVQNRVDKAISKGYQSLLDSHQRDYQNLFSRVSLNLGKQVSSLATDKQLAAYGKGNASIDRELEALYFQYGRYLLIASSRAGSLPANLQGVWNQSDYPPWNADYHVNINLQMNYWPAEITNLSETAIPLFDFIDSLITPGRIAAKKIMGVKGWVVFLNTNPWGFSGVIDWPTAFWQPEAAAWLVQHYYQHYLYTRDLVFLRERAYPAMKQAADFWLDALVLNDKNKLVVSPSYSPEHGPFTAGAAMSQQIVFDLLSSVKEAAEILGDSKYITRINRAREKLDPGLRVGAWGQLQEWAKDRDDQKSQHRHISHLYALHPGRQISPMTTPIFAEAAQVSLTARGDGGTGWAKAWKINLWARLLDGDHAHSLLAEQLSNSTLNNLWSTHPPFQIDGNFGATAGVAEMLVQSHNEEIHLLPALPTEWPHGVVKGLRARGDITLEKIHWSDGELKELIIKSGYTAPINLRSTVFNDAFLFTAVSTNKSVTLTGHAEQRTFTAKKGESYRLLSVSQSMVSGRDVLQF